MSEAATAPWVEFRKVSEEDRQASVDAGTYIARDVDYAFITPAGSKDCIEKPVKEWFEQLAAQVENNRFPAEWLKAFRTRYESWVESGEIPVQGTSVKNWAVASPSQIEMLLKVNVRTVEQLAVANEEVISRLGMGGRNLVEKAKAYTQQRESGVGKLAEENANLKQRLEQSDLVTAELKAQLDQLKAQFAALPRGEPVANPEPEKVGLSDLLDTAKAAPRKL